MTGPPDGPGPSPPDAAAVVDEFIRRLWAGDGLGPDANQFVLDHPAHAADLEEQLDAAVRLHREVMALPAVGRYRLAGRIGGGASAVVYRAVDTATRRVVALKVFPAGPPSEDRYTRDAGALQRLKHPHIVQLLDAGVAGGQPFLALELVEGGTLADRLAAGHHFPPAEAAALARKLADAAHYAHTHGVVHRDIKPGNVLLGADGEPQLADFGLARGPAAGGPPTRSGPAVGTPLYMAPEQVAGASRDVGPRTDVYALGAVLYEVLTGRPPFPAANPLELARRIADDRPAPPRALAPAVPPALEAVCLRCLEKDPADRFATAAALAAALDRVLAGDPGSVWRPSRAGRLRRWWRGQRPWVRGMLSGSAGLLVACGGLGAAAWVYRGRAEVYRQRAELAEAAERLDRREAEARARDEGRAALDRGWRALQGGQAGRGRVVRDALAAVAAAWPRLADDERAGTRFEARTLFAMSLAAADLDRVPGATFAPPYAGAAGWVSLPHPSGRWLAIAAADRPARFDAGRPPPVVTAPPTGSPVPRLAFTPDGRLLAFGPAGGGLQLWDGELQQPRPAAQLAPAGGPAVVAAAFTPDGGEVRACLADGRVRAWRTDTLAPAGDWALPAGLGPPAAARFAADAGRLAVGTAAGRVRVFTASGEPLPGPADPGARTPVQSLAWAPDGRTLAAGFKEGRVVVWPAGGPPRDFPARYPTGVDHLEYAPDGTALFAGRHLQSGTAWDAAGHVLLTGDFRVSGFAQDGRTVAAAWVAGVGLARWVEPDVVRPFRGHTAGVGRLAGSADGGRLVSLDSRYECRVWDVAGGTTVAAFPLPVGGFFPGNAGLALGGGGRLVAYAAGGRDASTALVRDVTTGATWGPWELPGGFDHLAALGGDRFRLVREEFVPGTELLRTVLYDLGPGRAPERLKVIREPRPGDTRRYFDATLTPDGRYYAWCGPREPRAAARFELFELPAGRRVYEAAADLRTTADPGVAAPFDGWLTFVADGRTTSVALPPEGRDDPRVAGPGEPVPRPDIVTGRNLHPRSSRFPWPGDQPSLGVIATAFDPNDLTAGTESLYWLPGGRWAAWADRTGAILVADRKRLREAVVAFESEHFK
ncbi:MAG: WD40 repeat domain-containing serine/threonine protein kinase [Gemmataceae bacterium]